MLSTKERDRRDSQRRAQRRVHGKIVRTADDRAFNGPAQPPEYGSWDEMVFENRNKDYGAYAVRKRYRSNLIVGVITATAIIGTALAYPSISNMLQDNATAGTPVPGKLVYTELSAPPPIDKPKPPPPRVQLPKLKKVIRFVTPKVVASQVADVTPTIDEISRNETGAQPVDAPSDVVFDEPVADGVGIGTGDDEIFTVVDQQPEYAGGYEAMMAFIKQNMRYPQRARQLQIEGTVHVSFIVSKTGEISDVKVLRGIMTDCDQEAVRVVNLMPPWKPGKQNGHPVNVRFILPLKFRIN